MGPLISLKDREEETVFERLSTKRCKVCVNKLFVSKQVVYKKLEEETRSVTRSLSFDFLWVGTGVPRVGDHPVCLFTVLFTWRPRNRGLFPESWV